MTVAATTNAGTWAARISERWRASVEAIIEAGRLLAEAKDCLPHGEFEKMIEADLPFGGSTARRLMAIAGDKRLSNRAHVHVLPSSWGTLYELTKLSDVEFEGAVEAKIIRPDMERSEVALIRPQGSDGSPVNPDQDVARQHEHRPTEASGQRSTGNQPGPSETLPSGSRAIMASRLEADDSLDYFPTPPWATRALIEHAFRQIGRRGDCSRSIAWEPACGEGHMAEALREYFAEVTASDVHDYGYGDHVVDFLECEQFNDRNRDADWIITNPPFGEESEKFVLKALDLARVGVAVFVRLQWLETNGRYENIFRETPPTLIAFFAERVNLCKGRWEPDGSTATAYIWLVWVKGQPPRAPFWIPPGCRESLSRPDDAERFTQHPVAKRAEGAAA